MSKFLSPDPDSRTKDDEGRRIEEIDGGWHLLNHRKYRDMASDADRAEKAAIRQQRKRDKDRRNAPVTPSSRNSHAPVTAESHQIPQAEAEAEADKNTPLPPKGEWSDFLESVWRSGPILTRTRSSKSQLQSAWKKLTHKPNEAEVLRVLNLWVKSDAWTKDSGQFAPGIHRWIQHRQWENVPEAQPETEGRGW